MAGCIRMYAQLFFWESRTIDPERWIAEPLGPRCVPTRKSDEENVIALNLKCVDCQLIRPGIRLVGAYLIGAEDVFENPRQAGALNSGLEHFRRHVRQQAQAGPSPLQGVKGRGNLRPRLEKKVPSHQLFALFRGELQLQQLGRED